MMIKKAAIVCVILMFLFSAIACGAKKENHAAVSSSAPSKTSSSEVTASQISSAPVMQVVSDQKQDTYEILTVNSALLGKPMRINIHLPPEYDQSVRYPVIYLFHGVDANEDAWFPYMGMEKTADQMISSKQIKPVILVAPEMDNSFGINSADTYSHESVGTHGIDMGRYEDYLCQELIPFIDSQYSTVANREGRYIGGFSMGGFIALHTSFLHSDLFSRVCGNSPAVWTDDNITDYAKQLLYPTEALKDQRDPLILAKSVTAANSLSIKLDCGSEDELKLYEGTQELYNTLKANGVDVSYTQSPGTHDYSYWSAHITEDLLFYAGY
jgi:enterochelin esterase-like enzyme